MCMGVGVGVGIGLVDWGFEGIGTNRDTKLGYDP